MDHSTLFKTRDVIVCVDNKGNNVYSHQVFHQDGIYQRALTACIKYPNFVLICKKILFFFIAQKNIFVFFFRLTIMPFLENILVTPML